MRRHGQRGMTLIELLIALVVTSIILVGLNGVFLVATRHYKDWSSKIQGASIGVALAANLQADSHRSVVCGDHQVVFTLYLCVPEDMGDPVQRHAVAYDVTGSRPYMITRTSSVDGKPKTTFMARSQSSTRPYFWADCTAGEHTDYGHIHVAYLRLVDGAGGTADDQQRNDFMVYYAAPWTQSCGP